eukprot:TRINITY_DN40672_c0_g1_i1.p1 TRINITY_DN40672_c0_g1~~TRINITY_DN40672_c0_g1_i1.p1  ORF type:complete len:967 (+),score=140.31 TRINITY_DN40672_c0_g1_i1:161-3061(+)
MLQKFQTCQRRQGQDLQNDTLPFVKTKVVKEQELRGRSWIPRSLPLMLAFLCSLSFTLVRQQPRHDQSSTLFVHDPTDANVAARILKEARQATELLQIRMASDARRLQMSQFYEQGLSPRPFFEQVAERYGAPPRQHYQRYGHVTAAGGRSLEGDALTVENTKGIRIHLNFDSLYKEKVENNPLLKDRYCFKEDDWYRVGNPIGPKPSGPGPDSCNREGVGLALASQNKWCLCTAKDVITEELKKLVIESTTKAVAEIPNYLRVKPVQGMLKLRQSEGSYPAMWTETGQQGVYCDADCAKGSYVSIPDELCSVGVAADAILSVVVPPPIPGVGGTGSFCSSDQNGRPLHLIFAWHMRPSNPGLGRLTYQELVSHSRRLVLHEALHGLGFGTGLWRNTFSSDGHRRKIIEQLKVNDKDGSEDVVFHFVKGTRTYEVAQKYFGCDDDSQWQGLPLMGWPPSGRDSHHETRIMRDDIMSYGDGDAISAITLATFEDTGHYVANYSNADCISWGQGRGCPFVLSRCEVRPSKEVVTGLSASRDCDRTWSSTHSPNSADALAKCAPTNCGSRLVAGRQTCDVECFAGEAASSNCRAGPAGAVAAAGVAGWISNLQTDIANFDGSFESLYDLALLILIPLTLCSVGVLGKQIFCPSGQPKRSKAVFYSLTVLVFSGGLAIVILVTLGLLDKTKSYETYVSFGTMLAGLIAGLSIACLSGFGILAVYRESRKMMLAYLVVGVLLLLTFVAGAGVLAKFARDVDGISRASLTQAGTGGESSKSVWKESGGGVAGAQQQVYGQIESFACRTYQLCCEPTVLLDLRAKNGGSRQCKSQHEGEAEDLAFVLSDPSHPKFCPSISGVNADLSASKGICHLIEASSSGGFHLERCQADYCSLGLEGYENFLSVVVAIYRKNMRMAGIICATIVAILLVQLINLYYIRKHALTTPVTEVEVEHSTPQGKVLNGRGAARRS